MNKKEREEVKTMLIVYSLLLMSIITNFLFKIYG